MRALATSVRCDLCGLDSKYLGADRFVNVANDTALGVDLCLWCMTPRAGAGARTLCGQHEVTFTDAGWWCSCGTAYAPSDDGTIRVWPYFVPGRVAAAVPDLRTALAVAHVNR